MRSTVTGQSGQEPEAWHQSWCAWASGTCTSAGHRCGLGTAQVGACVGVEYWMPHSVSAHAPVPGSQRTQAQPHRNWGLPISMSSTLCIPNRSTHTSTGNAAIVALALAFLLCDYRAIISAAWPMSHRTMSASYTFTQKPKSFKDSLLHRMFRHIHEALNIDENKN